ncbi:MAG: hypothetical protein RBR53_04500 [Desulforegulaceae bacterium]|nr:hypothetical protein [Desulforegulaceae bacterium]
MKINITLDITPEELRKAFGLPDLNSFNENIMKKMIEGIQSGKFAPEELFKTMNPASNPIGRMFMDFAMKNMDIMGKKSTDRKEESN